MDTDSLTALMVILFITFCIGVCAINKGNHRRERAVLDACVKSGQSYPDCYKLVHGECK